MIRELHIDDPERTPVKWWPTVEALKDRKVIEFSPGLTVIWGPNGAGKSTVLRVLARLTHCEQGGIPMVTNTSLRELRDGYGNDTVVRDGARVVGDGKPVHYLDPSATPGLVGGQFDDDFFRAGVEQAMFVQRASSGGQVTAQTNRILKSAAEIGEVEWRVPRTQRDRVRQVLADRCTAALRPTCEEGPPTLLLDEPDRSLSMPRQLELWHLLSAQRRFQVIVATHSPFALDLPDARYIDLKDGYVAECLACMHRLSLRLARPRPPGKEEHGD